MENNFRHVAKRQNISASSYIRITRSTIDLKQQQIKNQIDTAVTIRAKVHNNLSTKCVATPRRFSESYKQQASTSNPNVSKWHLLSLIMLFIIILWFNSIYGAKPLPLSFNSNITFSNPTPIPNLSVNSVV